MLIGNDEHYQDLVDRIDDCPDEVLITTYGIWAGILPDGRDATKVFNYKKPMGTRRVLDALVTVPNVTMVVSYPTYCSCKGKSAYCRFCEEKFVSQLIRMYNHALLYQKFNWYIVKECHLKANLFVKDGDFSGTAGGRNFTESEWLDVTFELTPADASKLYKYVKASVMPTARPLANDAISSILEDNKISPDTIEKILQS